MTYLQLFHRHGAQQFQFKFEIEHAYHAIGEWHNFRFHEIQFIRIELSRIKN